MMSTYFGDAEMFLRLLQKNNFLLKNYFAKISYWEEAYIYFLPTIPLTHSSTLYHVTQNFFKMKMYIFLILLIPVLFNMEY